jgi:protocatechuate 3,4-dioxygenase beta subunit
VSYRSALVLCYLEGKTQEEAAKELGCSRRSLRGRLERARERLRARLIRRGISLMPGVLATVLISSGTAEAVPAAFAVATVKAAAKLLAGHALRNVVPPNIAALTEGVLGTMFLTRMKVTAALILTVGLLVAGVGAGTIPVVAAKQEAAAAAPMPTSVSLRTTVAMAGGQAAEKESSKQPDAQLVQIGGRVLDPDGKPLAGAKLYVGYASGKDTSYPVRGTSGKDGRFEFAVDKPAAKGTPADDDPWVMAVADGYGCNWAKVGSPEKKLTLRLVKDLQVRGRIDDPEGKPVVGAKLTVMGLTKSTKAMEVAIFEWHLARGDARDDVTTERQWVGSLPGRPVVITTATDGRFQLPGGGHGRAVVLRLQGSGIASEELLVGVAEKVPGMYGASFEHQAKVSRPIRGVVRDKDSGKPVAGVVLSPGSDPRFKNDLWHAVSDKEGRYELFGVPKSDSYSLHARPVDGLYLGRRVGLKDPGGLEPLSIDIELIKGLTVRGKVTNKATGKPIAGALVQYRPLYRNPHVNRKIEGMWNPRSQTITGPDGSYALPVLPGQGAIGVLAREHSAYMPAHVTAKEIKAFFKVPLGFPPDDDGGFPVDVGGNAAAPGMDLGALYNQYAFLEPGEKDESLVIDIVLEPAQKRKGRVVGPDGQPLAGVDVGGRRDKTSVTGEFTLQDVNPKADLKIAFYHKEKNLGFFLQESADKKSDPLLIKLQRCGTVFGRLVDDDGKPLPNMQMHVEGPARFELVSTDKDGRFRVQGLIPGVKYTLSRRQLNDRAYVMGRDLASVSMESGQTKDLGDLKVSN